MSGTGQLGFAEAFLSTGVGSNGKLGRLDGSIDWAPVARLAWDVRAGRHGRPPYAPCRSGAQSANRCGTHDSIRIAQRPNTSPNSPQATFDGTFSIGAAVADRGATG